VSNIAAPGSIPLSADSAAAQTRTAASSNVLARMEALPLSGWHVKARVIVGSATFFDAVDTVAIGMVLPVIGQAWHLTPGEIGWLISGGFLGQMIGAVGFGQLAGRIGRIPTVMITTAIFALGGIASAFAIGFASMFVLRFLQGLGLGAEVPVAATYINEIAPAEKRGRFVLLYEFIFAVGIVCAGFVGRFAIPAWGWQSIFLIGSIPPLIVLPFLRTLPESPRWLVRRGRHAEAEQALVTIEQAVRASGKEIPPAAVQPPTAAGGSGNWAELFSAHYRTRTLLIWTIWITIGFISWPLTIWLPTIYRNLFKVSLEQALNYGMINNVVILVATLSCALLIDYTGRKAWFTGAFILAGAALCVLGLTGAASADSVFVLTALTLFGITSLNLAIYLYTPELYPTRLRALGVGIALAWARVAGMIAPPVIGWGMANDGLAAVFLGLGIIALIAAAVTAILAVETRRRILEEISP
jgi:MFS transporter, putative metabolite:H+ symporter